MYVYVYIHIIYSGGVSCMHGAMTWSMGSGMVHLASAWCRVQLHSAWCIFLPVHNANEPCTIYNVYNAGSIIM